MKSNYISKQRKKLGLGKMTIHHLSNRYHLQIKGGGGSGDPNCINDVPSVNNGCVKTGVKTSVGLTC
jgi:hypothetical protein